MTDSEFQVLVLQQFEKINNRFDNLETRFDNLETKVDNLETKVDNLETKVDKIDVSQVRMETELTEKIRGLYDGREVHQDYFASIKNTLARIETSQDSFRYLLYNVESKQREQERELRLLRVEQG